MIYKITNIDMIYDIKCNDLDNIEEIFREAQTKYENEDYATFFTEYFENELDNRGLVWDTPVEYILKW